MIDTLKSLHELRQVLLRLGAQRVARYWSNDSAVFASNFVGGAAAGAAAFIVAAVLLGIDIHRGENSMIVHALRALQTIVMTLRSMVEQELQ